MRLKDKIAIVTGGASGFGKGIVEKFIQQGAKVVIADVNIELAEKTNCEEIKTVLTETSGVIVQDNPKEKTCLY